MVWWWLAFVAWIGFGALLWRRSGLLEGLISRVAEPRRPAAALVVLFLGLATVVLTLLGVQAANGISREGIPQVWAFLVVLFAGCLFVGSQVLAASLILGSLLGRK